MCINNPVSFEFCVTNNKKTREKFLYSHSCCLNLKLRCLNRTNFRLSRIFDFKNLIFLFRDFTRAKCYRRGLLRGGRYSSGFGQSYHRKRSRKNQWNSLQIALQRNRYFVKYLFDIDRFMVLQCEIQANLPRASFLVINLLKGNYSKCSFLTELRGFRTWLNYLSCVNDLRTWANNYLSASYWHFPCALG